MKRKSVSFVACVAKRLFELGSQAGWMFLSLMLCLMTKSATESEASESASHSIAGNAKIIISRAAKIVTSSFWMTTRSRWQPFVAFPAAWITTEVGYLCGFSLQSFLMQLSLNEAYTDKLNKRRRVRCADKETMEKQKDGSVEAAKAANIVAKNANIHTSEC